MATTSHTAKRMLADNLLGDSLSDYVAARRAEKESWRQISYGLRERINLDISPESLRHWFAEESAA